MLRRRRSREEAGYAGLEKAELEGGYEFERQLQFVSDAVLAFAHALANATKVRPSSHIKFTIEIESIVSCSWTKVSYLSGGFAKREDRKARQKVYGRWSVGGSQVKLAPSAFWAGAGPVSR